MRRASAAVGATRTIAILLTTLALCLATSTAVAGEQKTHVVAKGQTLGMIAKRYHVGIQALCKANDIKRREAIKPGQKLVIPDPDDKDGSEAAKSRDDRDDKADDDKADDDKAAKHESASHAGLQTLDVPNAPPAYYYEPVGRGRLGLRPVIMYLHGRGGHPANDCKRWARLARRLGWVVCPSGQEDRGGGARGWDNNWPVAERVVMSTLEALRKKYGHRVQLYGNTLIGFSEGAYVAMNVGVREPRTFNRWLILAADNDYWGGSGLEALQKGRHTVRRVYLITGEQDGVIEGTAQVRKWLETAGVPVHASTPDDMGHELQLEKKAGMYRAALVWLDRGTGRHKKTVAEHKRSKNKGRKR